MSRILSSVALSCLAGILTLTACDAGSFISAVTEIPVGEAFSLTPEGITVEAGETTTIEVHLVRNNQPVNPRALNWNSTDPTVASVDRDGLVLGVSAGHTEIIASSGNLADTTDLVVVSSGEDKSGISVSPEDLSLDWIGAATQMKVHVYDETGTLVADPNVSWSSLDSEIAPVDSMGKVTARQVGLALIVAAAACCDRADTAYAEVRQVTATVAMSTSSVSMDAGETHQLTATPKDQGGTNVSGATVEWSSSNTAVATVSSTGLVSAQADGSATVTARSGDVTGTVAVQVGTVSTPTPPSGGGIAELPRYTVDTSWPGYTRVVDVPAGASIQAALNQAQPGDFIRLARGAVYREHITLPARTAGAPILIGSEPAAGRAAPGTGLPKIVGSDLTRRVIYAPSGANNYRVVGVEVAYDPSIERTTSLIEVDHASHIIFDRVVAVGPDPQQLQRAIQLHGSHLGVIDSYLQAAYAGADAQAIAIWSGRGPYHIEGNYLAGSGENVMIGGATATELPSDITIRRNHFYKLDAWRNGFRTVKNLFEIKFGQRILLEGNVLENNWADAQVGFALNIKISEKGAGDRGDDITIRYNIIRDTRFGIGLATALNRVVIDNNLILADEARLIQIISNTTDVHITNNTGRHTGNIVTGDGSHTRFVATGNIWGSSGGYGFFCSGEGTVALDNCFPGWTYHDNGHIGRPSSRYPADNLFVATESDAMFNSDWSLRSGSPFAGLGADVAAILDLTAGVR